MKLLFAPEPRPQLSGLSQITFTEDVAEVIVKHFHIRWSNASSNEILDWESFNTREEAQSAAIQLMRPNENYTIVQFDGDCPRCGETLRAKKEIRN